MKLYTLPDGSTVKQPDQFQIGNQKYPQGWLQTASPADIASAGITVADVADPPPVQASFTQQAIAALLQTDDTALRCFKAGVPFTADWLTYTNALRAIVKSNTGPLPVRPPFPAGS